MYTLSHDPSSDTQPSFEVTIETKRHRYCRSHQGGHIRTLRRGSCRRAVSGNIYGIQELFARVETVGIQPRDRHAGEMQRKVFINRHFVVASFVRTGLCLSGTHITIGVKSSRPLLHVSAGGLSSIQHQHGACVRKQNARYFYVFYYARWQVPAAVR